MEIDTWEVFAYEGIPTKDKRLLKNESLTWDVPLPVIDGETHERIGWITAIKREDDTIWATIDFDLPGNMVLSLSGADADLKVNDDNEVIFDRLRIAGAYMLPKETWAW